jgi:hypothetical protein
MRAAVLILVLSASILGCRDTITSPTETADTASVQHEFSSNVVPGGSVSREFALTGAGTIALTLTSTTPAGVVVGLGIGIPRADGSCALSAAVDATAGATAQIALAAGTGPYCAKVYDVGTLSSPVPFTVAISRP